MSRKSAGDRSAWSLTRDHGEWRILRCRLSGRCTRHQRSCRPGHGPKGACKSDALRL